MNSITKKIMALALAILMILPQIGLFGGFFDLLDVPTVSALSTGQQKTDFGLKFDSNGKFRVLQIADIQDRYPVGTNTLQTISMAVKKLNPDLIVLTGDNTEGTTNDDFLKTIREFISCFNGTPFAVAFGNHDSQYSAEPTRQQQYNQYVANGALDFDNNFSSTDLVGVGSGCVTIRTSDNENVAWNISILDSGTYDVNGYGKPGYNPLSTGSSACVNEEGYNGVVSWFRNMNESMKNYTKNGDYAPTLCFQHIPLKEFCTSGIVVSQNGTWIKNPNNPTVVGEINEAPCCSNSSTKELYKAIADKGNVKGIFYGHDHKNSVMGEGVVNYDGRNYTLVQGYAKGATSVSYNDGTQNVRFFELDENSGSYTTESYSRTDLINLEYKNVDFSTLDYSSPTYITELATAYSKFGESQAKEFHYEQGYKVLDCNLNEGLPESSGVGALHKADAVYLGYRTSTSSVEAITGIKFVRQNNNTVQDTIVENGITYHIVNAGEDKKLDLNFGTDSGHYGGKYIYTYYTTDSNAGAPITGIHVLSRSNPTEDLPDHSSTSEPYNLSAYSSAYPNVATWLNEGNVVADLNDGCTDSNRESVYLVYSRDTSPRFIGELGTAFSRNPFERTKAFTTKHGYIPLERDLNEGSSGNLTEGYCNNVALGYKYTNNYNNAIKAIMFRKDTNPDSFTGTYNGKPCTWHLVDKGEDVKLDLNVASFEHTKIYTYYTTDPVAPPLVDISIENSADLNGLTYSTFDDGTIADLNYGIGAGSPTPLYLAMKHSDLYSTVTFDSCGGSAVNPTTLTFGADVSGKITPPTKDRYIFVGFYDNATSGTMYFDADGEGVGTWDKIGNVTLYAHWELKNEYYYAEGTKFISKVGLYYSSSSSANAETNIRNRGYVPVGIDFNATGSADSHTGKHIHLGVQYTENPAEAITSFKINNLGTSTEASPNILFYTSNSNGSKGEYKKVGVENNGITTPDKMDGAVNLNLVDPNDESKNNSHLYLYATNDKTIGPALTEFTMSNNADANNAKSPLISAEYSIISDFGGTDMDCNKGAGGDYVYAGVKSSCQPVNSSDLREIVSTAEAILDASNPLYNLTNLQTAVNEAKIIIDDLNDDSYTTYNQSAIDDAERAIQNVIDDKEVTVTFDGNGGTDLEFQSITKERNEVIGNLPTISRVGYTFEGWFTDQIGGTIITESATMPIVDTTYYAHWTVNKYTITFDTAGGSAVNSIVQDFDSIVTPPANPTRLGYTFVGWDKSIPTVIPAENIIITAIWSANTYTATFNENGGTDLSFQTITKKYDEALGELPTVSREGYTFNGWYSESYGGNKIDENTTMPSWNINYYAQWTRNEYTITFDTAGGSEIQTIIRKYGTTFPFIPKPRKLGYTFVGWDKEIPATMPAENLMLTAIWTPNNYTVNFEPNGGTVSYLSKAVTYDSTYGELPTPTWDGHVFFGWFTSDWEGSQITAETVVKITAEQTLYAQWHKHNYINGVCECGDIIYSLENGAVTDNGLIYGLKANMYEVDFAEYLKVADGYSLEVIKAENGFGTGTELNIKNADSETIYTLNSVVFGDVNGDGIYDGMDSVIVSCIANGMLTREQTGEAVWLAADCNHDGAIDNYDVELLNQAGLILAEIQQSEDDIETLSLQSEYETLISQTIPTQEEVQKNTTALGELFQRIVDFIKMIFRRIFDV